MILLNKKLQVFVSSTYTDLIEERQTAVQAILDAGHIPAGMELFKAGKSQMETIRKWIDESDIYMLILGGRYGSIEPSSGKSYTHLEYEYALSKNMPVFAIILEDSFLSSKATSCEENAIFEIGNKYKYNSFKDTVESNIVKYVNNIDQISSVIHAQLNNIYNDPNYNLAGWIKGDLIIDDSSITLPPNIVQDIYPSSLKLKDSNINICPSCWYTIHEISPVNIKYRTFTCPKCGYTNS